MANWREKKTKLAFFYIAKFVAINTSSPCTRMYVVSWLRERDCVGATFSTEKWAATHRWKVEEKSKKTKWNKRKSNVWGKTELSIGKISIQFLILKLDQYWLELTQTLCWFPNLMIQINHPECISIVSERQSYGKMIISQTLNLSE